MGLERLAMVLFDVPDIRLFWSRDARFLRQFQGVKERPGTRVKFQALSRFPVCYKDVAFWQPDDLHENDVHEVLRDVAGDLAESLVLQSTFDHPKTGRRSRCYRVCYRSMERTLTNAEVDRLQAAFCAALVDRLHVVLR